MPAPDISVVIATHNEGDELARTVDSVVKNTRALAEIIVVDDGSTDGSCERLNHGAVRIIRHPERIGVACSRDEGSRAAQADVLCYLDGHQRVAGRCLDRCARLASQRGAIVSPDLRDYGLIGWRMHGATFRLCPERGYFSADWRQWFTLPGVKRVTGLRAPPYLIPRSLYTHVAWSPRLRGWGASEASLAVKSFFTGLPILHFAGPVARHRFQKRASYPITWDGVWRNQALIARVCFDDQTWHRHWLPNLFRPHLSAEVLAELESPAVQAEREAFVAHKRRSDREFWTELLRVPPPPEIG